MKRIYLDYAALTPIEPRIGKLVEKTFRAFPGNPSALHREGVLARCVLEEARGIVAGVLLAHSDEIVFTSGATEANNMALWGVVREALARGVQNPHVLVSQVEHPSVLNVAKVLAREGVRVEYLPVDKRGVVDLKELRKSITPETVLVSVMYVNNEIGTIEPLREIAKEVRHARKMNSSSYPFFHTDAAQAENTMGLNVLELGVDLMTLSSGKVYGPRGIGALFVRRGVSVSPLMYGGEHEAGRRPGTESPALALGFARALESTQKMRIREEKRLRILKQSLYDRLIREIPGVSLNGDIEHASPHILNMSVEGIDSESLVLYMDAAGIAVSGRSACTTSSSEVSHVILALGNAHAEEAGTVRFSLGRTTSARDIPRTVTALAHTVTLLREARKS